MQTMQHHGAWQHSRSTQWLAGQATARVPISRAQCSLIAHGRPSSVGANSRELLHAGGATEDERNISDSVHTSAYCHKVNKAVDAGCKAGLLAMDGPADITAATADRGDPLQQQRAETAAFLFELLQCTTEAQRRRVCKRAPDLLTLQPQVLQQRLQHLTQLLGGDEAAAGQACRRSPHVLKLHPDTLRDKVEVLSGVLGSEAAAVQACCKQPALLGIAPAKTLCSMESLQSLLGSREAAVRASQRDPSLLYRDSFGLKTNAEGLQQLLGLEDRQQLAGILGRQPSLLYLSLDSLRNRMQQLSAGLGMQLGEVQLLCAADSALLTYAAEGTIAKMKLIRAYPQYGHLAPSSFGRLFHCGLDRLARLQYLATAVAAAEPGAPMLSLYTVARMSNAEFNARFPGYPGWLGDNAERLQRETPPLKLAAIRPQQPAAASGAHGSNSPTRGALSDAGGEEVAEVD